MRRVALVAFNSAAHNKPSLVRDLLDTILPQLYNETKVRVSSVTLCCLSTLLLLSCAIHSLVFSISVSLYAQVLMLLNPTERANP